MKPHLLLLLALLLMLTVAPAARASGTDSVEISVTINEILVVEYVGDDPVEFDVTADDLNEHSKALINQGSINWWSNTAPWTVYVKRTCWDLENYGEDGGVELQVKYGPPDYDDGQNWQLVGCEDHHPSYDHDGEAWVEPYGFPWLFSPDGDDDGIGNGTYTGIDWKVKKLDWNIPPDTYTCTVTFTIAPD